MPIGLIGKKVGMTRVFTEAGASVPVTVIHAPANCVTQVKTPDHDGYRALQLSMGECKPDGLNKPMLGHYRKANVTPRRWMGEFRITEEEMRRSGDLVRVNSFTVGEQVDVVGTSKGKGFAGVIKRHHFSTQDATHGNSLSHRSAGSIGQCQTPGKVFKGKKMAGHMGDVRVTAKNLTVVKVDEDRELLLIQGAVPGSPGGKVWVHHLTPVAPLPDESSDQVQDEQEQTSTNGEDTEASAAGEGDEVQEGNE